MICCSQDTFSPQLNWHISMKPKSTSNIQNVSMLALYSCILLRSSHTSSLMHNSLFRIKSFHRTRNKLTAIITSNMLHIFTKMILCIYHKILQKWASFTFFTHQINQYCSTCIINNCQKIVCSTTWRNMISTPNITVYEFKGFTNFAITFRK